MPKPYPEEFREDVVRVAQSREPDVRIKDVAADFGITESSLTNWLAQPFTDRQLEEAWLANAIFDAHRDDPEFGYRLLADEVRLDDHDVSDRFVWRICRDNQWWSRFGKPKRGKGSKPGAPSHDDLARRDVTAKAPTQIWVTDLTEHWTAPTRASCTAAPSGTCTRTGSSAGPSTVA